MQKMLRYLSVITLWFCLVSVVSAEEATLIAPVGGFISAQVVEIATEEIKELPVLQGDVPIVRQVQTIVVELREGSEVGKRVLLENDYIMFDVGDRLFVRYVVADDGAIVYSIGDPDRRMVLGFFALLFITVVCVFGGWQGVRSLASLAGSFVVIVYGLFPAILQGYSPVLVSSLIAFVILTFAIILTHGVNRLSLAALVSCVATITLTGVLAWLGVHTAFLSGFTSEEAVYLNFNTAGVLQFQGLLLAAIMIGVVGVLDDIAITQAAVVAELHQASKSLTQWEIYRRALRVGREHVVALVNTLVFAYTSAALPLLLLWVHADVPLWQALNSEAVAVEIIRTIVGSLGLIATVPVATAVAVWFLYGASDYHNTHRGHVH